MKKYTVFILLLLVGCATVQSRNNAASIAPAELRCEYLTEPLGIDCERPRLSWKLTATDADQR
jgi:alpha-L-rhamnosidase